MKNRQAMFHPGLLLSLLFTVGLGVTAVLTPLVHAETITVDLAIEGAGKNNTIIDANGLDRLLHVLFGEVQISKVTICRLL